MSNEPRILVVDPESKSRSVLEVTLRKNGFQCVGADSTEEAMSFLNKQRVDLIICDAQIGDESGFNFCGTVKSIPKLDSIPFIFLTQSNDMAYKLKGYELGVDEYIAKPAQVKEVVARAIHILERREREKMAESSAETVSGELSEFSLEDILQTLEDGFKSGSIRLQHEKKNGVVFFEIGRPVDARSGKYNGVEAVKHLLSWKTGSYDIKHTSDTGRPDRIQRKFSEIIVMAQKRSSETAQLESALGGLNQVLRVDDERLSETAQKIPHQIDALLELIDGKLTIKELLQKSPLGKAETLQALNRLTEMGVLATVPQASLSEDSASSKPDLDNWLTGESDQVPATTTPDKEKTAPKTERGGAPEADEEGSSVDYMGDWPPLIPAKRKSGALDQETSLSEDDLLLGDYPGADGNEPSTPPEQEEKPFEEENLEDYLIFDEEPPEGDRQKKSDQESRSRRPMLLGLLLISILIAAFIWLIREDVPTNRQPPPINAADFNVSMAAAKRAVYEAVNAAEAMIIEITNARNNLVQAMDESNIQVEDALIAAIIAAEEAALAPPETPRRRTGPPAVQVEVPREVTCTLERDRSRDLENGRALMSSRDYRCAADYLRRFIGTNPRHGEALTLLGRALYELNDARDAIGFLERALSVQGQNAQALLFLGMSKDSLDDYSGAREAYHLFLEISPEGRRAEEVRYILDSRLQ